MFLSLLQYCLRHHRYAEFDQIIIIIICPCLPSEAFGTDGSSIWFSLISMKVAWLLYRQPSYILCRSKLNELNLKRNLSWLNPVWSIMSLIMSLKGPFQPSSLPSKVSARLFNAQVRCRKSWRMRPVLVRAGRGRWQLSSYRPWLICTACRWDQRLPILMICRVHCWQIVSAVNPDMTWRLTKTLEPSCRASSIAVAPLPELDLNMQVAHMDIKPENIMVSPCGTLKLGDMGLAWPKRRGLVTEPLGTPLYMAPEIREGLPYSGEGGRCLVHW